MLPLTRASLATMTCFDVSVTFTARFGCLRVASAGAGGLVGIGEAGGAVDGRVEVGAGACVTTRGACRVGIHDMRSAEEVRLNESCPAL